MSDANGSSDSKRVEQLTYPQSRVEVRGPSGFLYGSAVFTAGRGWRFLPNVAGRMPSRKYHKTSEASIPAWARSGSRNEIVMAGSLGAVEVEVTRKVAT